MTHPIPTEGVPTPGPQHTPGPLSVVDGRLIRNELRYRDPAHWEGTYVEFSGYFGSYGPHLFSQAPALLDALQDALEFIDDHADVVDGPDGEQLPNRAMSLAQELREVLAKAGA